MSGSTLRRNRIGNEADVDMTPMLDIVFIMLIFFIVTATFLDERGLNFIQPPDVPPMTEKITPSISVYVDKNNRVSLESEITQLAAVGSRVERLLAEKPDANIILTADSEASLNTVSTIKDKMNEMGRTMVIKINKPIY